MDLRLLWRLFWRTVTSSLLPAGGGDDDDDQQDEDDNANDHHHLHVLPPIFSLQSCSLKHRSLLLPFNIESIFNAPWFGTGLPRPEGCPPWSWGPRACCRAPAPCPRWPSSRPSLPGPAPGPAPVCYCQTSSQVGRNLKELCCSDTKAFRWNCSSGSYLSVKY